MPTPRRIVTINRWRKRSRKLQAGRGLIARSGPQTTKAQTEKLPDKGSTKWEAAQHTQLAKATITHRRS
jgi:hypothetical protein